MTLNVKTLSALDLVKALDDYPAGKYPDENQALRSEIRHRIDNLPQENTEKKNQFGQGFINSWPKKLTIFNIVTIVLLCIFVFQYATGSWSLNFFLVVLGVMANSYLFHVMQMKRQLAKPEILERVAQADSLAKVNKILKAPIIYRVIEALILVLMVTMYLFSISSLFH